MPGLNLFGLPDLRTAGVDDVGGPDFQFPGPELPPNRLIDPIGFGGPGVPIPPGGAPNQGVGDVEADDCNAKCSRGRPQIVCPDGPSGDSCRQMFAQISQEEQRCFTACQGQSNKPAPDFTDIDLGFGNTGGSSSSSSSSSSSAGGFGDLFSNFSSSSGFTDNPLLQQLQAFLSKELEGPFGLDPRVIQQQRNIITGSGAQNEQRSLQNLAASLNTVGQLGGGRQIELSRGIAEDNRRGVAGGLQQLATLDALKAQEDRDAIVGQTLGFGGLLGQESSQGITQGLGQADLALRKLLGERGLGLQEAQFTDMVAFRNLIAQLQLLGIA